MSLHVRQTKPILDPAGRALLLKLIPLVTDGPASLAPDRPTRIARIALTRIVLLWRNAFNEVTIRTADDLFACAVRDGAYYDPIPKGAELIQATLEVQFDDCAEPHSVQIVLPHTLILQHPADAPRVLSFLARRGFLQNPMPGPAPLPN